MSEPWWRRRKKKDPWIDDIYEELERLGDLIDETIQKAFEASSEKTPVQGFSIKIGHNRKPRLQEFTKRTLRQKKNKANENQEPLVDIIEDAETLVVLVALPGVKKDTIDLSTTSNRLTISIDTPNLEYHKELKLPSRVDPKSAHAFYKNGVLKIRLEKLEQSIKDDKISLQK